MGDGAVPIRRDNLTEAVSREIQRMIRSGEVAPGAWLPPQPELAARFGVGLSTLREGIKGLTLLGILSPQPGRGTQVNAEALHLLRIYDMSRARLEGLDVLHLIEARRTIEVALTVFAASRATAEDIARVERALEAMRRALADDDAFAEADLDFHLAVAQAGHNPLLEGFYHVARSMLAESIRESVRTPPGRGTKQDILQQQGRILDAIRAGDARSARRYAEAVFAYWDAFVRLRPSHQPSTLNRSWARAQA
ncbi:MAG: FadR/GntR family transcriptional regulator [Anaerolineae bacterium]